ncbi:hypothetical protein LCGC14_1845360, partial [marine sediment metagenome]
SVASTSTESPKNNDDLTLATTRETGPLKLPTLSSTRATVSDSLSKVTASTDTSRSSGVRSGTSGGSAASLNNSSPSGSSKQLTETIEEARKKNKQVILKQTHNGEVSYTDSLTGGIDSSEDITQVEIVIRPNNPNIDLANRDADASSCKVKNIGVNTGGINYHGTEMPLYDLAKQANGWTGDNELDENGYPKSINTKNPPYPYSIISDDLWGRDRQNDKRYVVLYDGEGDITFSLSGAPTIIKKELNRIEIELRNDRFALVLQNTNPSNYIRNIRIIPIDRELDYATNNVRKDYVAKWSKFGVVRYLDLQRTNNSTEMNWADRKTKESFGGGIMSLEEIVDISNAMGSDPWLLVPHRASDGYITKMAQYVRDNLDSDLTAYIEYSNEAWNYSFKQTAYFQLLAKNNNTTIQYEYGVRAKNVFEIWTNILGQNRIKRVIGTHIVNPWLSGQIMKTPGLAELTDALAVGYYIGNSLNDSSGMEMTEDEIIDFLETTEIQRIKDHLEGQKQVADNYNIELVAYEAGQHLAVRDKSNSALVNKYISVNRNPRMRDVYHKMYDLWKASGGGLIMWFQTTALPTKWGVWGLLENMSQNKDEAPKYMAVQDILSNEGCY